MPEAWLSPITMSRECSIKSSVQPFSLCTEIQGLKLLVLKMERNANLLANLLFYKCLFLGQSGIYKKHQPQMEKASSFVFFVFFCSFGQPSLKPCAGALWRGRGKVGAQDAGFCGRGVGGQAL